MKCHRCGLSAVMHVVGRDYCLDCEREMKAREPKRPLVEPPVWLRRLPAKDLTDWRPVA